MCESCGCSQPEEEKKEEKDKYECEGCGKESEEQKDCGDKPMKRAGECGC